MNENDSLCCRKAYEWTLLVNEKIGAMPKDGNKAFSEVLRTLRGIYEKADIAVVSSANRQAVREEWEREGLFPFVSMVMTQEDGGKAVCIEKLLHMGYEKERVLMVGDARGDIKAAETNEVFFYPILVNREDESWKRLRERKLKQFFAGRYGEVEEQEKKRFYLNLEKAIPMKK